MNYVKLKVRVYDKATLQRVQKLIEDMAEEMCDQAMFDPVALHVVNALDSLAHSMKTVDWPNSTAYDENVLDALTKDPNK